MGARERGGGGSSGEQVVWQLKQVLQGLIDEEVEGGVTMEADL